jgi:hypothetical protein
MTGESVYEVGKDARMMGGGRACTHLPIYSHHIFPPCLLCPISSFMPLYPPKQASIFDFSVKDAQGNDVSLRKFEDKKALLIVNVASR